MTLSSTLVFAVVVLVAAATPGPGIAALVSRVVTHGFRDVLPFLVAMWVGEVFWSTLAITGLAALAHTLSGVFIVLRYLGAAYLLLLAWCMWHAPADEKPGILTHERRPWRMFRVGLLVSLSNPKVIALYLALLPSIINLDDVGISDWAILTTTILVVVIGVDLSWALIAGRVRRLLRSRKAIRFANRTSATVMTGAAVAIAVR